MPCVFLMSPSAPIPVSLVSVSIPIPMTIITVGLCCIGSRLRYRIFRSAYSSVRSYDSVRFSLATSIFGLWLIEMRTIFQDGSAILFVQVWLIRSILSFTKPPSAEGESLTMTSRSCCFVIRDSRHFFHTIPDSYTFLRQISTMRVSCPWSMCPQ